MSTNLGVLNPTSPPDKSSQDISPFRILALMVVLIFTAEMIAMFVINYLALKNPVEEALLDGLIMIFLIFPSLNFLQLQPLLRQIRERSRAEQSSRANEKLLTKVLEQLPVGVSILDQNGELVHGNPASWDIWVGSRYLGSEQLEEFEAWQENMKKRSDREGWAMTRALRSGEITLNKGMEIESFNGGSKDILNSALPILNDQNEILGAIVVDQDITRIKEQERALIHTNELLEKVFLSIDIMIAYLDRDMNFVKVNDNYARGGGYPREFYIGKNHFDLFPNEENQAIFRRVMETGEPYSVREKPFKYVNQPELGVTYWDWNLQPVMAADGLIQGVVLSLVDVTKRKLAEIQLERQNQELRELTRAEHEQRELAESLVQASLTLNASLEPDWVLGLILKQIRKAIPFQGADIVLLEDGKMRVAGFLGSDAYPESALATEGTQSLDDFPSIQQVCTSLKPLKVDEVKEYPGWHVQLRSEWVRAYIAVPLIIGGQVKGVIELYSDRPAAFSHQEVERLLAFAAPAALALHNARLYQTETNARQFAETLSDAALALTQTLDLEHVFNTLLDHLLGVIHYDIAQVTMMEGEGRLVVRAMQMHQARVDPDELPASPIDPITDSVLNRIAMTRKSLTIPNILPYPDQSQQADLRSVHSWLIIPIIANDLVIGLAEIGIAGAGIFPPDQNLWAEALVGQAAVAIQNAWLFEQVRSSSGRLQSLARKLVEVQESERYHIARELHDEAGQALSSLKLSLGRLEQDPECPPHMSRRLLELKSVADYVLEDLHRLAMDLRPAALDHLGLIAAVEQLAKNMNSDKLSVRFKAIGFETERLPQDMETSLYRIVQEALTNVVRHANACNVGILLERIGGKVKLFVEDDGIGLEADYLERGGKLGLVGMRERAEMLRGRLSIESAPGSGTSIIVEVPDGDPNPYRR